MYNSHSINFWLALQTLLLFLPSFLVGYLHLYLLRNCHKQSIQLREEHWKDPEKYHNMFIIVHNRVERSIIKRIQYCNKTKIDFEPVLLNS